MAISYGVTAPPKTYNPGAQRPTISMRAHTHGGMFGGVAGNIPNPYAAAITHAANGGVPSIPQQPPQQPPHNSATTQTPAAPDPRDSSYYANVAANQFKVNNKQNALGEQGGYATVDLQNALAKLAYQQPRDELKAEQAANNRGGLYSSVYNQQLGDLAHAYQENNFNTQQAFDRGSAARAAQSKALDESVPLYNAQQYAAATIRAANQASQDKSLGESGKPLVPGHPHGKSNTQRLAATIAGRFVQGQAHNGAPWAKAYLNWSRGNPNAFKSLPAPGYRR